MIIMFDNGVHSLLEKNEYKYVEWSILNDVTEANTVSSLSNVKTFGNDNSNSTSRDNNATEEVKLRNTNITTNAAATQTVSSAIPYAIAAINLKDFWIRNQSNKLVHQKLAGTNVNNLWRIVPRRAIRVEYGKRLR